MWNAMASPMRRRRRTEIPLLLLVITLACLILDVTCKIPLSNMALNSTVQASLGETLMSPGGVFEMGFYAGKLPGMASQAYTLAIWYAQTAPEKTVVWMADRSVILTNNNASLILSETGDLQVYDGNSPPQLVWRSNTQNLNVSKATLLDTGNFCLLNRANKTVWQSFDSPTDTLLPNQLFPSTNRTLLAWKKGGDWRQSRYAVNFTTDARILSASWQSPYPWATGTPMTYWQAAQNLSSNAVLTSRGEFQINSSDGNSSVAGLSTDAGATSRLRRVTLDTDGNLRMYSWSIGISTKWNAVWQAVDDLCVIFGICGDFSVCGKSKCFCPEGFRPVNDSDASQGCTQILPIKLCNSSINAGIDTMTSPMMTTDYPYVGDYNYQASTTLQECLQNCLNSCFCEGATVGGSGVGFVQCWLKKGHLINGRFNDVRTTYLRVNKSKTGLSALHKFKILAASLGGAVILLSLVTCLLGSFVLHGKIIKYRLERLEKKWISMKGSLTRFTYKEVRLITKNFSEEIGKGGYGTVYKGDIGCYDKNLVAVKRLDRLGFAEKEFVNEVDTIGRIHHVHLVHLLGYCAEREHRMLMYDYMRNSSLDKVLFRSENTNTPILDWRARFNIAIETAKALQYLHDDVRDQRIIHCDIKPENILLDTTYSAKVADFGLSRIMNRGQTRTMTMHIRGTTGYLAPEWTSDQMPITTKTDVYSYGMVLLEIIAGRRNMKVSTSNDTTFEDPDWYFPSWAFAALQSGSFMDVVDPSLKKIVDTREVKRALEVAFWCINEKPQVRPSMAKIVQILEGQIPVPLPLPKPNYLQTYDATLYDGGEEDLSVSCVQFISPFIETPMTTPSPRISNGPAFSRSFSASL